MFYLTRVKDPRRLSLWGCDGDVAARLISAVDSCRTCSRTKVMKRDYSPRMDNSQKLLQTLAIDAHQTHLVKTK